MTESNLIPNEQQVSSSSFIKRSSFKLMIAVFLFAILLLGAYLRFTGQNWDDFTHLHPDERFLTLNLLPNIGGGLEFTPDEKNYPAQTLVKSNSESRFAALLDFEGNPTYRLGTLEEDHSKDIAQWWLSDPARIRLYSTVESLNNALALGEIDAILTTSTDETNYLTTGLVAGRFSSQEVQRIHCEALNPSTGGIGGYFDAACSNLNPHNAANGFYTYGTLPLFLAHYASQLAQSLDFIDFQGGHLIWRFLSALFDMGSILIVFFIGQKLLNNRLGLFAALIYACAPLAIEKAHYGTVNAITAFFVLLAILFAISIQFTGKWRFYALFGIATGAAVAGRINTAPLAGMVVVAAFFAALPIFDKRLSWDERGRILTHHFIGILISGVCAFIAFRIFNPYAFSGPSIFGLGFNDRWFNDIASGSFGVSGYQDAPPNWQWLSRPSYIYPLSDMILWGFGFAAGIMAWFGWGWVGLRMLRAKPQATHYVIPFIWILGYFLFMGRQWVMTMRYYLPLYGVLAIFAAWALVQLIDWSRSNLSHDNWIVRFLLSLMGIICLAIGLITVNTSSTIMIWTALIVGAILIIIANLPLLKRQRGWALASFVLLFSLLWALMFSNIYQHQLTRVQGSRWIWENVPGDFAIAIDNAPPGTPLINIALGNDFAYVVQRNDINSDLGALGLDQNITPDSILGRTTYYGLNAPYFLEFTAPASGTISEITAPHLADPLGLDTDKTLRFAITPVNESGLTPAIGELTSQFSRQDHILGSEYKIPLTPPLELIEGQTYTLKVELVEGEHLIGSGSVVLTEGDWDDRLTSTQICELPDGLTLKDDPPSGLNTAANCNGRQSWTALVNSYDQAMSYPLDDPLKVDNIIESLAYGDYLTISSNRFYDTLSRNPARWPVSNAYYRMLFDGRLGFDLVATFDETYEWGPFRASDQYLPTYTSPSWLNELESDEAFHVYDHPAVFIFKKTAAYSDELIQATLGTMPTAQAYQVPGGFNDPTLIGVVNWPSIEADQVPTALYLTHADAKIQSSGGTWSDRFDLNSILYNNQFLGVLVWWLTIMLYGWVVYPILYISFPDLSDRGYAVSKFVGLLLVAFISWLFSSIHVPLWSQSGVIIVLLGLSLISLLIVWFTRAHFFTFIRQNKRRFLMFELLMLAAFLIFIFVRLTNPDLWHPVKGGEKPMDFAYFNAVLRSTSFPAYDPWHAGGFMNYYYFGFVFVGSPVLLLQLVPSLAYNLIIPTLFSITGIGAFSVAFNITASWRERSTFDGKKRLVGNPWIAGIAALCFAVLLGNLDTVRVLGNGLAKLGGYTAPSGTAAYLYDQYMQEFGLQDETSGALILPVEAQEALNQKVQQINIFNNLEYEVSNQLNFVSGLLRGLQRYITDGEPLPLGSDRWYWGPSRVLTETPGVEGNAITEMPYFTFLYGDLHAHMIDMPFLLFILLFIFNELLLAGRDKRHRFTLLLALFLGALSVGLIRATNTWDWPSFLLLSLIGLSYVWWLNWKTITRSSLLSAVAYVGGFAVLSILVAVPYTNWYAATYNSIEAWQGGKTPLWAYFDIHGLFLFIAISLLIWETIRWFKATKLSSLRGKSLYIIIACIVWLASFLFAFLLAVMEYQVALIVIPMIVWIIPLFFRSGQSRAMQFVLVLLGFALALTLGVEMIVISGDIGRQNTVFKYYMQVWLIFSAACGAALAWIISSSDRWPKFASYFWYSILALLVTIAALFPIMATQGRAQDRMAREMPLTLDGMAYMAYAEHYESNQLTGAGQVIPLSEDYAIIRWLQENVTGSPTIIEGRRYPSEYMWNGRIAINTGLPSVLGWSFHQRQQRTFDPLPRLVDQRAANIMSFYDSPDMDNAVAILRHYKVEYIIVSGLEHVQASEAGLAKFTEMLDLGLIEHVFETEHGGVYHVNQAALDLFIINQIVTG